MRHANCGFSLLEVLISLLLVASFSLALIHQQWQTLQIFNQMRMRTEALIYLDNASEHWLATGSVLALPQPFQLQVSGQEPAINLHIRCELPSMPDAKTCDLKRQLVRG